MTTAAIPTTGARTRVAQAMPRKARRFDTVTLGLGLWTVVVYIFLFLPISFVVMRSCRGAPDASWRDTTCSLSTLMTAA